MSKPAPPSHLVLYGSLRRGEAAFAKLGLEPSLSFVHAVRFPGRMYDLGEYPGVVLDRPNGVIQADLFVIADPEVLARLDAYEGFRPRDRRPYDPFTRRGSLYLRKTIPVDRVEAYVYVFNAPVVRLKLKPTAPSGDWLRHRRARGRA